MFKKFGGNTYQFAKAAPNKTEAERSKKRYISTGFLKSRASKDDFGYLVWVRPVWMDVRGRPREEYSLKFGSDDLRKLIRAGY